jgi:hypothetical protein
MERRSVHRIDINKSKDSKESVLSDSMLIARRYRDVILPEAVKGFI